MSKHNYSQYSNKPNKANKSGAVNPSYVQPATTPKANKEFAESVVNTTPNLVQETVETVSLPELVEGTVVNCAKLNVRAEPSVNAEVVCVLDAMSEIEIDVAKSNNEWFKVYTAIGAEGYCMRQFVSAAL